MQLAHKFGRRDVDRVLVQEGLALHAHDEAEGLHVGGKVPEVEGDGLLLVEVAEGEVLEVAYEDVPGFFVLRQGIEVGACLLVGVFEVAPGALLLDDEHAGPEQVDEAGIVVQLPHVFFVAGHAPPPHAEDMEEVVVEGLRLALLVGRVAPLACESRGARADLVPGKAHQVASYCGWGIGIPSRFERGRMIRAVEV